jgi:methyl-accepting chemotaxis protein
MDNAATAVFNVLANKKLEELLWSVFITAQSTGEVLKPIFIYANIFSLIFICALLALTWTWMLKKINGPLIRMNNDLKMIQDGNFTTDIILRRNDEFADVAAALNDMLTRLRQRFGEFKTGYDEISRALVDLEIAHAKGLPVNQEGERLVGMVNELRNKILLIDE